MKRLLYPLTLLLGMAAGWLDARRSCLRRTSTSTPTSRPDRRSRRGVTRERFVVHLDRPK